MDNINLTLSGEILLLNLHKHISVIKVEPKVIILSYTVQFNNSDMFSKMQLSAVQLI